MAPPHPAPTWNDLALDEISLVTRTLRLNVLVSTVVEELAAAEGLTGPDYLVLGVLRLSPGSKASPTTIARVLGRSSGGMTLTIDRLEEAGWLARTPDPDDRRRVVVGLTDAGLSVAARINAALHEWEDGLGLSDAAQRSVNSALDTLVDAVHAATEATP